MTISFSILITTHNRKSELLFTLHRLKATINRKDVEYIVCDDGSSDGTFEAIQSTFPEIILVHNKHSIGLIGSRNKLLSMARGNYAISLDDDAHFLSQNPLEIIEKTFSENPQCGVIAFRIYWGIDAPKETIHNASLKQVRGFVGCGHAWNMNAWKTIPNYPEWFIFYGEEDFAAHHLFLHNLTILYVPDILIHHRVDVSLRKQQKDYRLRLRRSLRSGWYLMILFYPWWSIPRRFAYSFWTQLKKRTLSGDMLGTIAIFQAIGDLIFKLPKLIALSQRYTEKQFHTYSLLTPTKIYWSPIENTNIQHDY